MLLETGCVTHRGPWRVEHEAAEIANAATATTATTDGVELVLLSNLAPEDRGARAVATRVEHELTNDRPRIVLWLGDVAAAPLLSATPSAQRRGPRCTEMSETWTAPAAATLARATGTTPSFGVMGVLDHRCGSSPTQESSDGLLPWRMPGSHYVIRVFADGSVQERIVCGDGNCTFAKASPAATEVRPLVDLVVVDLAPWIHPSDDPSRRSDDERRTQSLEALLTAVAGVPPEGAPPRLLVSNVPVEAGGEHGLGALWPDATFHGLPTRLQQMLIEGHFAGVLAGYDRSLQATDDLAGALKRSDRAWLRAPVFQVVAGAVSRPNRRASMALRSRRVRRSQAYSPPLWSDHAGFAVVRLHAERAELTLHAYRGRHWESASMVVPLRPSAHPNRTPSPHMAPCRDCPAIPASER